MSNSLRFRIALFFAMTIPSSFIVLLFTCFAANAQLKQVAQIDTTAKSVYVDNLDHIYLLSDRDELLKYDAKGTLKWRYSNNRFGKLHSVDVSDPLRTVLFYADFQQVVVLNNNLNEITSYSFAKDGNLLVSTVASGNNNSLWIFDRAANALIKLSSNFTEDVRSANLFQLFDEVVDAKKMAASDQYVFLQRKNEGILQFDRFGGYVRELPIDSLSDFNITSNVIAYFKGNDLIKYHPTTFESSKQQLPVSLPIKQVAVGNKLIAVLTEKAVFLLSDN
ncbi:hypothetical protein [Pedobacter xixiisoli]|uniref:PQQ-like domain-containing protein n=1 Tax=Pedobacter xixiisoli TaxID=1476464 RepID=A0A286ADW5_9SPHI|nr:hypothetical protein [Pedobacter xixiisoli]SOD20096.1 hypothetical protein SAMN06297358_3807 [Pedobacter xixiisoli]